MCVLLICPKAHLEVTPAEHYWTYFEVNIHWLVLKEDKLLTKRPDANLTSAVNSVGDCRYAFVSHPRPHTYSRELKILV